jgi:hypothetical protein
MNNYLLVTEFQKGDVVAHVLDDEFTYVVQTFHLNTIDNTDTVTNYTIGCTDPEGGLKYFFPNELKVKVKCEDVK